MRDDESFEAVKKCYASIPQNIQEKYRGRFTPIIDVINVDMNGN
jgi:hypothetical protein